MTERRQSVSSANMRICFPEFSDETHPAWAEEMNEFYRAFRDAAAAYAEELNPADGAGGGILLAEYRIKESEGGVAITYRLCLRRRGRILAEKQWTHLWKEGVLVPEKKKRGFFRK